MQKNQIATLTGTAIQDNETFLSEGGFLPERDQYYFQLKKDNDTFFLGLKDILLCIRLMENMGELPKIDGKWWLQIASLYGQDILMVECDKKANYIKEYVPETEEPQRQEIFKLTKEHFDKAIYLLQKETGIYITLEMAKKLAENYVKMRAYNYIDATVTNIPWYLLYSFSGFPLYHMMIRKNTVLHKQLIKLNISLKDSKIKDYVYVTENKGYLLTATNYRYAVDKNDNLNEWLDFSIIRPDDSVKETLLYTLMKRFSIYNGLIN